MDWWRTHGVGLGLLEAYGYYRASGLVTDFSQSPLTRWMFDVVTQGADGLRQGIGLLLSAPEALIYPFKFGLYALDHYTHNPVFSWGSWHRFSAPAFHSLQNWTQHGLDDVIASYAQGTLLAPAAEWWQRATQGLDQQCLNLENLVIGVGLIAGTRYLVRRKYIREFSPVTGELGDQHA